MQILNKPIGYSWLEKNMRVCSLNKQTSSRPDVYLVNSRREKDAVAAVKTGVRPVWSQNLCDAYDSMGLVDHISFALKHEGIDLYLLSKAFTFFGEKERSYIAEKIAQSPKSRDSSLRRLGYLCEKMTKKEIPLPEDVLVRTAYDPLFDPNIYYTLTDPRDISIKYKITDNAIGDVSSICPIIRRNERLDFHCASNYGSAVSAVLSKCPEDIQRDVAGKAAEGESQRSFEFEKDAYAAKSRIDKFKETLLNIDKEKDYLTESNLVALQNIITSKFRRDEEFRDYQNFIGVYTDSKTYVSYLPPAPKLLRGYMYEVRKLYKTLTDPICGLDPILAASAVSSFFILAHPFNDGNGRISRFLLQDICIKRGYSYNNIILPVSEVLAEGGTEARRQYIQSLADITGPMMKEIDFTFEEKNIGGRFVKEPKIIKCDSRIYAYPDITGFCESIYNFIKQAAEQYLPETLLRSQIEKDVSLELEASAPEINIGVKRLSGFIGFCINNGGRLSNNKKRQFRDIPTETVDKLEGIVNKIYNKHVYSNEYELLYTNEPEGEYQPIELSV